MTILVTGGAGFIGSQVAAAYLDAGHRVIVVDDLSTGSRDNLDPRATFEHVDIRGDALEEVFRKERIDVVNHHAAQMDVRRSVADPRFDASINVEGGLNVFECARKYGSAKIVFASTGGAIYGEQLSFPADEEHPLHPLSPYGITKLCTEKYLYYYKAVHGIDHVILRYANVYGPRQNPHGEAGVVAIFANKLARGEQPMINGDGTQTRDYTYVEDVVRANVEALRAKGSHIYNVGTGVENDVNMLFHVLRKHFDAPCEELHGPPKAGEQLRSVVSAKKIERELGWRPEVGLDEGLRRTAEYFRKKVRRTG